MTNFLALRLKAHCCKDGKVRVFNSDMNWERMRNGADRLGMPEVQPHLSDADISMRAILFLPDSPGLVH
eukprot:244510-Amorphochlora_amoeboformis.AAC.1